MDTLRRVAAGLLLVIFMSRSALTVDTTDPHRNFTDPTLDPKSNYSKVTCDFANDTCGWENVGGYDYPLTWQRKNGYMHLKMKGAGNSKGGLASPWLPPLSRHHSCRLRFQYYIPKLQQRQQCRLSLYRQAWPGEELRLLWSTHNGTGVLTFSDLIHQHVHCGAGTFRMVFEGWKDCSQWPYNEIDVKSIKFIVYPEDVLLLGAPSVWVPDSSNKDNSGNNSHVPKSLGVTSADPISQPGIIVTVVVGIVIVGVLITVIVIVRRRRLRRRRQRDHKDLVSQHMSGATTNSTHGLELQHTEAVVTEDTCDHPSRIDDQRPAAMSPDETYDHTSQALVQDHLYSSLK